MLCNANGSARDGSRIVNVRTTLPDGTLRVSILLLRPPAPFARSPTRGAEWASVAGRCATWSRADRRRLCGDARAPSKRLETLLSLRHLGVLFLPSSTSRSRSVSHVRSLRERGEDSRLHDYASAPRRHALVRGDSLRRSRWCSRAPRTPSVRASSSGHSRHRIQMPTTRRPRSGPPPTHPAYGHGLLPSRSPRPDSVARPAEVTECLGETSTVLPWTVPALRGVSPLAA